MGTAVWLVKKEDLWLIQSQNNINSKQKGQKYN